MANYPVQFSVHALLPWGRVQKAFCASLALFVLAGCSEQTEKGVHVESAWALPTGFEGARNDATKAYFAVLNYTNQPIVLKSVDVEGRQARFQDLDLLPDWFQKNHSYESPAGPINIGGESMLDLYPGGAWVEIRGLEASLEDGDSLPLTLIFEGRNPMRLKTLASIIDPRKYGEGADTTAEPGSEPGFDLHAILPPE